MIKKMISYLDKPKLPKVLSIDKFKGNSDNIKYHCIILDPESSKLLDIISDKIKKIFFNCRKLILKRRESLDKESLEKLELIFWHNLELANAYELKEMFFRTMDEDSSDLKAQMLSKWISFSKNSNIKDFDYYLWVSLKQLQIKLGSKF